MNSHKADMTIVGTKAAPLRSDLNSFLIETQTGEGRAYRFFFLKQDCNTKSTCQMAVWGYKYFFPEPLFEHSDQGLVFCRCPLETDRKSTRRLVRSPEAGLQHQEHLSDGSMGIQIFFS